jgi:acyl-CoA synthetase (AMP-forming)/AMP-acid ligase II
MLAIDIIKRQRLLRPEAPAVTFAGRTFTYADLYERSCRTANALSRLGVGPDSRVAVLSKNCHQYVELYFGASLIGAVTTPLNYRLSAPELAYIINDAEVVCAIVGEEYVGTIDSIRGELTTVRELVCIGGARDGYHGHEDLLATASADAPIASVDENDLVYQMYTSGTTGRPKGAMITHRNLVTNVMQISFEAAMSPHHCNLIVAPLYHAAAVITAMYTMAAGASLAVKEDFIPDRVLRSFSEDGITHALFVPAMILFLLSMPGIEDVDFGPLERITYGASPIPAEVLKKAIETFRCDFLQAFGQTESVAVLTVLGPRDHVVGGTPEQSRRLSSCGRPAFGVEIRVVDENDKDVDAGELGEIIARGPNVMKGYWKMPEATADTLRGGWLHTGDLGTMDERGYVFIMDRLKDMIVSGGENVYPREIEEVLFTHPGVADAAVIGVPSARWGEDVKAVVVLKADASATAEELIEFCGGRLAGYKRPRTVDFLEALPKNPSGKVLKRELREPYWKGVDRRVN